MKTLTLALLLVLSTVTVIAEQQVVKPEYQPEEPWFSTFSITAFDPETKDLGVAVASRPVGAGPAVLWAEAGVAAIATQAGANQTYGPKAVALIKQGLSPAEVVKKITDEDPGRESRQVAVIDMQGRTAVYTAKSILDRSTTNYAGSIEGKNYSVQGNTLASAEVVKAMAAAYEAGVRDGKPMEERLMDALDAGNEKGGDARGMGSAGILVVRPPTAEQITSNGRRVDRRVDHHENPFKELRRILGMSLAGRYTMRSTQFVQEGKFAEALIEQKKAFDMNPSVQIRYGLAQRYAQAGEYLNALRMLEEAVKVQATLKQEAATNAAFTKMKEFTEFKRLIAP